jgi:putative flippase GtrA
MVRLVPDDAVCGGKMETRREGLAMLRYLMAGAVGVVVGLICGYALHLSGVAYLEATGIGYAAGFCANYSTARFIVKVVKV